ARGEGGSLAVTASLAALEGAPLSAHYAASKGAMLSVMRALPVGLARHRIRVNAIVPGLIDTPMPDKAVHGDAFQTPELLRGPPPLAPTQPAPRAPPAPGAPHRGPPGRWAPGAPFGAPGVPLPRAASGSHPGDLFVTAAAQPISGGLPPSLPLPPRGSGRGGG